VNKKNWRKAVKGNKNINTLFVVSGWTALTLFCYVAAGIFSTSVVAADLPASPGAEGFGAATLGGRGGRVIEVTSLNGKGPGTLRAAIEASGPRIVVFRVSGVIFTESVLNILNPYITIAGQTAPGGGICLKGQPLIVNSHDVVVRFIRSRVGPTEWPEQTPWQLRDIDAISVYRPEFPHQKEVYNVILDHVTASWSIDEVISTSGEPLGNREPSTRDVTIQWFMIYEGLSNSVHSEGEHSKGMLIGALGGGDINTSVHHNLFAHYRNRNAYSQTGTRVDFVNNVIYDWGNRAFRAADNSQENLETFLNIVGNYFKPGPSITNDLEITITKTIIEDIKVYVRGNIGPHRPTDSGDEWSMTDRDSNCPCASATRALDAPVVTTWPAAVAYKKVLNYAGAMLPVRDVHDTRVANDVRNGTGCIIDDPNEVGGWPAYNSTKPPTDSDHDGMPDNWETKKGLNPNDSNDSRADCDGDGYTNVEEYLNGLVPSLLYGIDHS
jgi:pectate lyase